MNTLKTRREFIRESALIAALAAIGGGTKAQATDSLPDGLLWQKAPCRFCGTGCDVLVGVANGKVVAVQGDTENPVNKGLLCAKGYHAGAILYGKDRLTHPQIRKNGKLENWKTFHGMKPSMPSPKQSWKHRSVLGYTAPGNGQYPKGMPV